MRRPSLLVLLLAILVGSSCGSKIPFRKIFRSGSKPPAQEPEVTVTRKMPTSPHLGHPRLYFSATELVELQAKGKSSHAVLAKRIGAYGDFAVKRQDAKLPPRDSSKLPRGKGTWRIHGNRLLGLVAATLFHPEPTKRHASLSWAKQSMDRMADWRYWGPSKEREIDLDGAAILTSFAIAYDALYGQLEAGRQKKYRQALIERGTRYYQAITSANPPGWTFGFLANHNYIVFNALLHVGLAVLPEHPTAQAWIDLAATNTAKVMELRNLRGDGSDHEGPMYATYGDHGLFPTLDLLRRFKIKDYTKGQWFRNHFDYLIHCAQPGWTRVVGIGDNHGIWGHGPEHLLFLLARQTDEPRANWLALQLIAQSQAKSPFGKPEGGTLFWEYLWYDPSKGNEEINSVTTATSHYFEDWGTAFFRRGWNQDDTYFAVSAGDPAGKAAWNLKLAKDPRVNTFNTAHDHAADGGFVFLPGGLPLITGSLYEKPKRTALHSTWTFGPAEKLPPLVSSSVLGRYWNEDALHQIGRNHEWGQIGEWNEWFGPAGALTKEQPSVTFSKSHSADGLYFASVEISGSYRRLPPRRNKPAQFEINRLSRNFLLLPDDTLVIVDRVKTSKPIAAQTYFRSISTRNNYRSFERNAKGARLLLGNGTAWQITAAYPVGMEFEVGKELFSIEDAKGKTEVSNWQEIDAFSIFLRASNPHHVGEKTYIFLLHPESRSVTLSQTKNGVDEISFVLNSDTGMYPIRIGFSGNATVGETQF